MIKPSCLSKGDTIGIISPSGLVKDPKRFDILTKHFTERGYAVKLSPHCKDHYRYYAGEHQNRRDDLMDFFADDSIKAIFCARGGYGCTRYVDQLDYSVIQHNPKIFMGFSDITALHAAILKNTGLITFHGPLSAVDFGAEDVNTFTWQNMWPILEGSIQFPYTFNNTYEPVCLKSGEAEGILFGGNLTMLSVLIGTRYMPDLSDKILFIEEVGESLYKIDRLLTHLKLSGVFEQVKGVIFGEFSDIPNSHIEDVNSLSPLDIIRECCSDIPVPAFYGFSCGHNAAKLTLPLGTKCYINCNAGILSVIEEFVISEKK